ncbi:MAG: glycosyltransferase family 2 protein [Pseudomonadota bacterium]
MISVIVVSYNTADFLSACLSSIRDHGDPQTEIIVIDNASQDQSQDMVRHQFPEVKLIVNQQNEGFARANNQAARECGSPYLFFLNPDTVIRPGVFGSMIRYMESHPEVGLAGTRIINPDGSLEPSFEKHYPGQRHAGKELRGLKGEIAWVLGASMIVRENIFRELGGFDERFFLYGDDQDLCLRVRKAGWILGYIKDATVIHWGGRSERGNLRANVWKKKLEAEIVFYKKNYSEKTYHAIRLENIVQAYWRILTLKMSIPFVKEKQDALGKLEKYRVVKEVFRQKKALHKD